MKQSNFELVDCLGQFCGDCDDSSPGNCVVSKVDSSFDVKIPPVDSYLESHLLL